MNPCKGKQRITNQGGGGRAGNARGQAKERHGLHPQTDTHAHTSRSAPAQSSTHTRVQCNAAHQKEEKSLFWRPLDFPSLLLRSTPASDVGLPVRARAGNPRAVGHQGSPNQGLLAFAAWVPAGLEPPDPILPQSIGSEFVLFLLRSSHPAQVAAEPNSSVTQNGPWRDNITSSGSIPQAAALVADFCRSLHVVPIQVCSN